MTMSFSVHPCIRECAPGCLPCLVIKLVIKLVSIVLIVSRAAIVVEVSLFCSIAVHGS